MVLFFAHFPGFSDFDVNHCNKMYVGVNVSFLPQFRFLGIRCLTFVSLSSCPIAYFTALNGNFVTKIGGGINDEAIDDFLTTGIYHILGEPGFLWVNAWDANYAIQIKNIFEKDEIEYRIMRDHVWGSWYELAKK